MLLRRALHPGAGLCAVAALAFASVLPAHGGQYRGPGGNPPGVPMPGGGPLTGGPGAGPNTGGRPGASDSTSWQVWWEFNKDPILVRPGRPGNAPVTGSGDYFLGPYRHTSDHSTLEPSEKERRDLITTALLDALRANTNRDIVTACLVGLAKVGLDPYGGELQDAFLPFLSASDQEVRETAALALGIAGKHDAVDVLSGLVQQTPAGRNIAGRDSVPERTRAFAAWSLGLIGRRSRDLALKRKVHDVLLRHLQERDERNRDLRVALVEALGLLDLDPRRGGGEKLLLWRTVGELWDFYRQDLGKGNQLVQAHVPIAVARLLGRGTSSEHQSAKRILAAELFAHEKRNNAIYQSAALALGTMCLPGDEHLDDAEYSQLLLRFYKEGTDQQARFFCAISLGRIGGEANRAALLSIYDAANKAVEKPWIALALGLIARERPGRANGDVDAEVGRVLLRDLRSIDNNDAQAALAVAIGLCGYKDAAETLTTLLFENMREDMLTGYVAVALALLDHAPAADSLAELMQRSSRRPFVLQQCAVALGRLGDVRAVPILQDMMRKSENTAALSAVATALGYIGDRRSIEPLVGALTNAEATKLARAFAAAALGGVGDKDVLPWNTPIAVDMNYRATVDTLTNGSSGVLDIL